LFLSRPDVTLLSGSASRFVRLRAPSRAGWPGRVVHHCSARNRVR
jgi:hypothetical protein